MIIETIAFCHYSSVFGLLLGLFQYLPTILYFGAWFWSLYKRDSFFVGLAWTMNFTWIAAILFKFAIGPLFLPQAGITPNNCASFIPSAMGAIVSTIFFGGTNSSLIRGVEFPHVDVMQAGIYNGYLLTFLVAWHHSLKLFSWTSLVGIVSISFVPWAFISAGVSSTFNIGVSFVVGVTIGTVAIFMVYRIVQYLHQTVKNKTCFYFWCGDPTVGLLHDS